MNKIYQEHILEHGRNPFNRKQPDKFEASCRIDNAYCGDWVEIFLCGSQSYLKEYYFWNRSCILLQASASILMDMIREENISDFFFWKKQLENLLHDKYSENLQSIESPSSLFNVHESIYFFKTFNQNSTRKKCILLPWDALAQTLIKLPKKQ